MWHPRSPRTLLVLVPALIMAACTGVGSGHTTTTAPTSTSAPSSVPGQPPPVGPEGVPIPNGPVLGPVKSDIYGQPVDDIQCQVSEQVVYHVHAHLAVFVDGQPRQVPFGIGIGPALQVTNTPVGNFVSGGSCFYWLHTHVADGVIHIESPTQRLYTLGQFFDLWGQALAPGQVGPVTGTVTVFVDGQPFTGNPRDIELKRRSEVQLDVGTVVPPQAIDWGPSGL